MAHGIDWTAYDEAEKRARRCLIAEKPLTADEWDRVAGVFFGALFTAAGLIWWMLLRP